MKTCPDDKLFLRAFQDEIDLDGKERLVDHVLTCRSCRIKFDLLSRMSVDLKDEIGEPGRVSTSGEEVTALRKTARQRLKELGKSRRRAKRFFGIPAPYLAGASAVILIAVFFQFVLNRNGDEIYRDLKGGSSLRLISPRGIIHEIPSHLVWEAPENADAFTFKIVDDDLNTLLYDSTTLSSYELSDEVRKKFRTGVTYIWWLEACDEAENVIAKESQYFRIE